MADELQHLLERIQSEGVAIAEEEASQILAQARRKAAELVEDARKEAETRLHVADVEAQQYAARSERALQQAARDLLLTVGGGIQRVVDGLVRAEVEKALDLSFLRELIGRVVAGYMEAGEKADDLAVLVSPEAQVDIVQYFHDRYAELVEDGLEITVDERLSRGFRVLRKGSDVYHDFSNESIADALSSFLQPHLAKVMDRAAHGTDDPTEDKAEE